MDLSAVMSELGARMRTLTGIKQSHDFPPDSCPVLPAAVVGYPDTLDFDESYDRGLDSITLPVYVVLGSVDDKATHDAMGAFCDGSGAGSVKQHLESGTYTSFHTIRVASVDFGYDTEDGAPVLLARFDVEITGSG